MHTRSDRTFLLSVALATLLFLWGGFTLFVYLGSPVHSSVLLTDAAQQALGNVCQGNALFCRGVMGFGGFVSHTIGRMAPLAPFLILSLLAYAVLLGITWFREERLPRAVNLRPWHMVLLFLGLVWLQFMTLSYGKTDNIPTRVIFEPTPQIYQGATPQVLDALKENFQRLQSAGCLQETQYQNIPAFRMTGTCLQAQFVKNVLSQFLFILLLLAEFLVLGRALLRLVRVRPAALWLEALLSLGLGACGWMVLLWTLAVMGVYTTLAGWSLLVLVPALLYSHTWYWARQLVTARWEAEWGWGHSRSLLLWLLLSYLALNFLTVIRPFPIGWDDLGSYVNRPRLLVSYGHFIPPLPAFQWEYLTSLGFLLFGYDSPFGATAAMQVNWMAGLLAVWVVWGFGRVMFGVGGGILAALLYYVLPMVGHFSYADMKIDNAVFALGSLALLCVFMALYPPQDAEPAEGAPTPSWSLLLLAGVFCGFAFAVKPTAAMVTTAALAVILGAQLGAWGYGAGWLLSLVIFAGQGVLNLPRILERMTGQAVPLSGSLVAGVALIGVIALLLAGGVRRIWRRVGSSLSIFVVGFAVAVVPWILHNNFLNGNIIPRLALGAPNTISPQFNLEPSAQAASGSVRTLPPSLRLNTNSPMCKGTALQEELDRYWGFDTGIRHYAGLPWRSVMNLDSAGYYVTELPALLLFPLLLLLPFFWTRRGRPLRGLWSITLLLVVEWVFLANGVPWYGIGMFLGIMLCLEALVRYAPGRVTRTLSVVLLAFSILIAFGMRFWQFEQQQNLYEYAMGKVSNRVMQQRTIPWYDDIRKVVMDRHDTLTDRPYLYRMGTFIPYFIPKNLEVIGNADNQLDFFNCLFQERNPELTLRRLNALGFNSMVFDTNTSTIESNPQGTLHQKVKAFLDFANSPVIGPQNILVNDPQAGVAFLTLPQTPPETASGATVAPK